MGNKSNGSKLVEEKIKVASRLLGLSTADLKRIATIKYIQELNIQTNQNK